MHFVSGMSDGDSVDLLSDAVGLIGGSGDVMHFVSGMSDGDSVDLLSDAIGFIGGSSNVISCCRGIGVVIDLISRGVGIVGCGFSC